MPRVSGRADDIHRAAAEHGNSLSGFTLLGADDAAATAVDEINSGPAPCP